jgi:hypothetical protein
MEKFTVRDVSADEEKSKAEIESQLLEKHAEAQGDTEETVIEPEKPTEETETPVAEDSAKEIGDEDVLSFLKNRYNKDISSVDDLLTQRESNEELPEDVSAFLKYKKETGRGIEDFYKVNQNLDDASPDQILAEYWGQTQSHMDADDISFEMDTKYGYDEELDEQKDIKKKQIAKKAELVKAKEFFQKQKEQYQTPLESRGNDAPGAEDKDYEAYRKYVQDSKSVEEENKKRRDFFSDKTNELFTDKFEGFKFKIEDKELVFKPGKTDQMKEEQSDVNNFISKHVDDSGLLKNAESYHRALSVAMNPDGFAKFFYEQGKSDAVTNSAKESKNIDMSIKKTPQTLTKGGLTVRSVTTDHGSGLRIKSNRNK